MKKNVLKTWLVIALFYCSAMAHGHNFHAGISDISMNVNTGNTEIIHTLMTHDVEALLQNLYQRQFDLDDPDDIAIFKRYLEKQFSISDAQGKAYPINWVGLKVDQYYVMVFQEIEKQELPAQVSIRLAVLSDFLPEQINTLNFSRSDKHLKSYTFTKKNNEQFVP